MNVLIACEESQTSAILSGVNYSLPVQHLNVSIFLLTV